MARPWSKVRAGQAGVLRAVLCAAGDWRALGQTLAILSDGADEVLPDDAGALADWPVEFEVN